MKRVAILHQGTIPTYRRAFYELLSAAGRDRGVEYTVFHGEPLPGSGVKAALPPFSFPNVPVRNRYVHIAGRVLVWQPVVEKVASGLYDAVVLGHEVKYLSSLALFVRFRIARRPVIWWGFGNTVDFTQPHRRLAGRTFGRAVAAGKRWLVRGASGYLAYTERGAAAVVEAGMPESRVRVLYNTIDLRAEIAAHTAAARLDEAVLRQRLGVQRNAVVLAFVGRLNREKEVELLIEAVRRIHRDQQPIPVEVLIVGEGPWEDRLRRAASGERWCHFLGYREGAALAEVFRVAAAVVIPGYVGLTVNHAFAHGVPIITRKLPSHSPEIEYVIDGYNGLILPSSFTEFTNGLREFVTSAARQRLLADGALTTRDQLDMSRMVYAFNTCLLDVLGLDRRAYHSSA